MTCDNTTSQTAMMVLYDDKSVAWETLSDLLPLSNVKPEDRLPVSGGASVHRALHHIVSQRTHNKLVLNLCNGHDDAGGVSARAAAALLESCHISYSGCRADLLHRPLDVLFMMMWYAGMPMPRFAVVSHRDDAAAAAERLRGPLRAQSVVPMVAGLPTKWREGETSADALRGFVAAHGKSVVWEDALAADVTAQAASRVAYVLVSGGLTRGALAVRVSLSVEGTGEAGDATLREWAASFSRDVLYHRGTALLTFAWCEEGLRDNDGDVPSAGWRLGDVALNPGIEGLVGLFAADLDCATLLRDMATDARDGCPVHNYEVRLNADSRKGYSLCAARAIRKGEVIFEDECRSFAMVTRPFVEETWDRTMKQTFAEYAWPLDADGHLYAIWEKEPTRWRPMNHSCDPACIFAAPHSLNVIAARDLAPGEDLTMDYATFCDHTMQPFHCLCGASCCRGRIVPDEATLKKYGAHAWLRRVPPPVKPLNQ